MEQLSQVGFEFRSTLSSEIDEQDVFRFLSLGFATYRSVDELPEYYSALPSADELRKLM